MSLPQRPLLILIACALVMAFLGSAQPYRSDDVWSLRAVAMPWPEMMDELKSDIHPPLYYLLLRGWVAVFGEHEVVARGLSILLLLAAAAVVFHAARQHFGVRAAMLALAIFIVSPTGWLAASLVRMYGLLALASAASTWAYLGLLTDASPKNRRAWLVYIAANIVGSFTQIWFFFLLAAQGITYVLFRRTRGLGWMSLAAVVSLAPYTALWLPTLLGQINKASEAIAWVEPPGFADLAGTTLYLGGLFTLTAPFALWSWRKQVTLKPALPLLAVAALTVAIPFALSFWKPVYGQRFVIAALPAFALGIASLAPKPNERTSYPFETALATVATLFSLGVAMNGSLCSSRAAAEYLAKHTRPGDTVVFSSLSRLPIDYYWNQLQPQRQVRELSFPAEIDRHPGFEGTAHTPARRGELITEAKRFTEASTRGRVFFLHGFRPKSDEVMKQSLATFTPEPALNLTCASMGSYFQYISAFSCRPPVDEAGTRRTSPRW